MYDSRMVAASERFADFRKAVVRELPAQIHCDLAGLRNLFRALLRVKLACVDIKEFSGRFLYIGDVDNDALGMKEILHRFLGCR